jgi:excisionase family DNA binding protein
MSLVVIDKNELEQALKSIIKDAISEHFRLQLKPDDDVKSDLIQISDVAKILNVSLSTVHSYKRQGILPFYRIGRRIYFKKDEVIEKVKKAKF